MPNPSEIKNCPIEIARGLLRFRCPKRWDDLNKTGDEGVRLCDKCNENVHVVSNYEELGHAYREGLCVAIKFSDDDGREIIEALGWPEGSPGRVTIDPD